jgi:esterase/lipase
LVFLMMGTVPLSFHASATIDCKDVSLENINAVSSDISEYQQEDFTQWFGVVSGPIKGVAIVAHGLNLKPARMNAVVEILNGQGIEVLRLTLRGHRGYFRELKHVRRHHWLADIQNGYCLASARAKKVGVPLFYVGYSVSALMGLEWMVINNKQQVFNKVLLFAPALSIRSTAYLVNLFKYFGDSFFLPSKNLDYYRAYWKTPNAAYRVMMDAIDHFNQADISDFTMPVLIILDPQDELVSHDGLKKMIEDNGLSSWEINTVSNARSTLTKTYHHLIIDDLAVGKNEWDKITYNIKSWIGR